MSNYVLTYSVNVYVDADSQRDAIEAADVQLSAIDSTNTTRDLEMIA